MKYGIAFLMTVLLISCGEEVLIKPKAVLHLSYPDAVYQKVDQQCPYSFEVNTMARIVKKNGCNMNILYPKMKAIIHLTYTPLNNNLDTLLFDAQKLTYDHTSRASKIDDFAYEDTLKNVYGQYFELGGNAATLSQFYLTDTLKHFINGSMYFNSKPNFDSLYPAAVYLRADIKKLMESLEWEN